MVVSFGARRTAHGARRTAHGRRLMFAQLQLAGTYGFLP